MDLGAMLDIISTMSFLAVEQLKGMRQDPASFKDELVDEEPGTREDVGSCHGGIRGLKARGYSIWRWTTSTLEDLRLEFAKHAPALQTEDDLPEALEDAFLYSIFFLKTTLKSMVENLNKREKIFSAPKPRESFRRHTQPDTPVTQSRRSTFSVKPSKKKDDSRRTLLDALNVITTNSNEGLDAFAAVSGPTTKDRGKVGRNDDEAQGILDVLVIQRLTPIATLADILDRLENFQPWAVKNNKTIRQAEANLDRFWDLMLTELKAFKCINQYTEDLINKQVLQRTEEPQKKQLKKEDEKDPKEKTRGVPDPDRSENPDGEDDTEEEDVQTKEFHLTRRAFDTADFVFSPQNASGRTGEIHWNDPLNLVSEMGCTGESLMGAAWRFTPGPRSPLDGEGSINLHAPHGRKSGSKLTIQYARVHGRMMKERWNLEGARFVLRP
ncbi:Uu.00g068250.m01.CDS01 [Anthostomella pinea]|uniref:Uu.00g068250.m01.CDS01 n=1 Tax=Anthostomella pinea TaxID=933095 RepID=A0AAI8VUX5_9PEZI|nr:Uu.00g068250.m01.CDS01 [Anthostomella pinea]